MGYSNIYCPYSILIYKILRDGLKTKKERIYLKMEVCRLDPKKFVVCSEGEELIVVLWPLYTYTLAYVHSYTYTCRHIH